MDAHFTKKIVRELQDITANPAEGIRIIINEQNLTEVQADIDGPVGTPYQNGVFRCRLIFPADYPAAPPKGYFITKVFHPNVSPSGEICVNVLKKDWSPDLGVRHVLMVIKCLLVHTNPESALNEEAGRLLLENYDDFAAHARLMTSIHAQSRKPTPLTASGGNANGGSASHEAGGDKPGSPAAKKAKSEQAGGVQGPAGKIAAVTKPALAAKKSLKRL